MSGRVLATPPDRPDPDAVAAAAAVLGAGGVVGLPTDTVYGLAVDPWQPGSSDRLFAAKGRPRHVALPVLVADRGQAERLVDGVPAVAAALMDAWWPGALTLVLRAAGDLGADLGSPAAGPPTVGVRCPDHAVARAVAAAAGPIATSSANRHGAPPATRADEVAGTLPGVELVLDAGPCTGEPSTVIDCTGPTLRLLRAGHLDWAALVGSVRGHPWSPPA